MFSEMSKELAEFYKNNKVIRETIDSSLLHQQSYQQALENCILELAKDNDDKQDSIVRFAFKYGADALREPVI